MITLMQINVQTMGTFLSILSALFTATGTIFAKQWSLNGNPLCFAAIMIFYLASSIVFPFALRHGEMTLLATISSIAGATLVILIGLFVFKEQNSAVQGVGIFSP